MSTHNIHVRIKSEKKSLKYPEIFAFLGYYENVLGTQKISHAKRTWCTFKTFYLGYYFLTSLFPLTLKAPSKLRDDILLFFF